MPGENNESHWGLQKKEKKGGCGVGAWGMVTAERAVAPTTSSQVSQHAYLGLDRRNLLNHTHDESLAKCTLCVVFLCWEFFAPFFERASLEAEELSSTVSNKLSGCHMVIRRLFFWRIVLLERANEAGFIFRLVFSGTF